MEHLVTLDRTGRASNLRCEYAVTPLGVDKPQPKLGWEVESAGANFVQAAYRIVVASDRAALDRDAGDLWDSGKVTSNRQNAVRYEGAALEPATRYWWKVRLWDRQDRELAWSEPTFFETGLFSDEDWDCRWFNCEYPNSPTAVYYERREFETKTHTRIASARAYIGATGSKANAYELRINGVKAGDDLLSPGQTHFTRGLYRTYDVTELLAPGANAIGIMHTRKLIFRLDIRYADGTRESVVSDGDWKRLKKGPYIALRYAGGSISEGKGETYDARLEPRGWDAPGFDDSLWRRPILENGPLRLTAQLQSISCAQEVRPVSVFDAGENAYLVDFGQNLFGTLRIVVKGEAGEKITLRYAEILNGDGTLYTGTIEAGWLAERQSHYDEYILRGDGEESYQPTFACHGFRYVEVSGYPGALTPEKIVAKVIHNDILNGSEFVCGSELLNRLQHAAVWSFRSNLVSVPMDCPTRERQGWLGDAHCHSEADLYNFDMAAFYEKWFDDISDSQLGNGIVPVISPSEGHEYHLDMPWVSAVVFIPWEVYMAYGDAAFLSKHYSTMKRCLAAFGRNLDEDGLLQRSIVFGDWFGSVKDISKTFLATAYYYRCLDLLSRIAEALREPDDAAQYAALAQRVKTGINRAFLKEGRYYDTNSQTANALALYLGFAPDECKADVVDSLVEDIRTRGTMTVGCLGAEAILAALADNGRNDVAYSLANNTSQGCWGYWIEAYGATTALETFADDRSSNNHAFLIGGLSAWFYKHLAGISPLSPGYERIRIRPYFPADLERASAQVRTVRGVAASSWRRSGDQVSLAVIVPPNSTAEVHVPNDGRVDVYTVGSGTYEFQGVEPGRR